MNKKDGIYFLIFITLFFSAFGFLFMLDTDGQITYSGNQTFETTSEALSFLEDVSLTAHSLNATIYYNELSLASPPSVKFSVKMPMDKMKSNYWIGKHSEPFKYGEQNEQNAVAPAWFSVLGAWLFFAISTFLEIFKKRLYPCE